MPNSLPNLYTLPTLPGMDGQTRRVMQDLVDQLNFLTGEVGRLRERDLLVMPTGAARRESPIEGIITIPYRDAGGQDGLVRVSKDGVIVSYVNPVESIFPYVDLTTRGNVTTGLDPLHDPFIIPGGTMTLNGDTIEAVYAGQFAINDNNKSVNGRFGGQAYENSGVLDIDGGGWQLKVNISRVSSTTVRATSTMAYFALHVDSANAVNAFGTGFFYVTRQGLLTVANLDTTATIMEVLGEGIATDDVQQTYSYINFYRPRTVKLV
jgi:hypothetical protein